MCNWFLDNNRRYARHVPGMSWPLHCSECTSFLSRQVLWKHLSFNLIYPYNEAFFMHVLRYNITVWHLTRHIHIVLKRNQDNKFKTDSYFNGLLPVMFNGLYFLWRLFCCLFAKRRFLNIIINIDLPATRGTTMPSGDFRIRFGTLFIALQHKKYGNFKLFWWHGFVRNISELMYD